MGTGSRLTPELKDIIETWVNVEHWTPEQIAGNVQDVDVSAAVIRLWVREGLIDICKYKYHRQNGIPKERAVAQTKRAKEREIARLREQLKNDGELVRHSIFNRSQVVKSHKRYRITSSIVMLVVYVI